MLLLLLQKHQIAFASSFGEGRANFKTTPRVTRGYPTSELFQVTLHGARKDFFFFFFSATPLVTDMTCSADDRKVLKPYFSGTNSVYYFSGGSWKGYHTKNKTGWLVIICQHPTNLMKKKKKSTSRRLATKYGNWPHTFAQCTAFFWRCTTVVPYAQLIKSNVISVITCSPLGD